MYLRELWLSLFYDYLFYHPIHIQQNEIYPIVLQGYAWLKWTESSCGES